MATCTGEGIATALFPSPIAAQSGRVRAPGVDAARDGGCDPADVSVTALPQADRADEFVKQKQPRPPPTSGDVVVRLASRLDRARALLASILRASGLGVGEGQTRANMEIALERVVFMFFTFVFLGVDHGN